MELAIPGIALGLLYVVTNQSKKSSGSGSGSAGNEGFTGRSLLPNVDVPNRNYPGEYPVRSIDSDLTSQLSTANPYDNGGGVYTDKYFNPNLGSGAGAKSGDPKFYSLTGDKVDANYFEHNNMVPFFGSTLRTRIADENNFEGLLDTYQGAGSQTITKKEQSPLFSPHDNLQWANGAPNESDFYQSRVNPSMRMANVKPFEEEIVGPGLNLGYTSAGGGGFNAGMMARDMWVDKTADQLRVDNKPKATGFTLFGHEGPATSYIKTNATQDQMGIMEKRLPEQSFELGQDRYFTTTGVEKGPTMRAIPVERHVSRPETAVSYAGAAGYQNSAAYVPGEYMPSHNQQLGSVPIAGANAGGRGYANDGDYGIQGSVAYPNNRTANTQNGYFGLVSGSLGAAIAPLLDVLRPSRRENVVGTLRPYQNPGTSVPQSYIFNPADKPAPTIRETTENSKFHLNVNANQRGGAYEVTENQPVDTYRKDQGDFYYAGVASAGAGTRQTASYESGYNQRNNDIKASTIDGRLVPGNMSLLNSNMNIRENTRDQNFMNTRAAIGTMPYQSPDVTNMGRVAGNPNSLYSTIQLDRNTPDILEPLKGNPFVMDHRKGL